MTANKESIVREYAAAWPSQDIERISPLFTEDCEFEDVPMKSECHFGWSIWSNKILVLTFMGRMFIMKLRIYGLMILSVFCFGVASTYAEEPKEQMYYVYDVIVSPSKANMYETAHKALMASHLKQNYPVEYTAYSSNDFHYYFIIPIANLSDIDNFTRAEDAFRKNIGDEKYKELLKGFSGVYEYLRTSILTYKADISYVPGNNQLKPEDIKFFCWNMYYIKPGKEQDMNDVLKKWVKLSKQKKLSFGWNMSVGGMGHDTPCILESLPAKNASEHFVQMSNAFEFLGKDANKLWDEELGLLRKMETKYGQPRLDLSYTPKKE